MAPPATNGRYPNDPDRDWILRALRGDITSATAYRAVATARELDREGRLHPEAAEALEIGDLGHGDDNERFRPLERTWETRVGFDPDTQAAFDRLTRPHDDEDGYHPTWDLDAPPDPREVFIDWQGFWDEDPTDEEWLIDQVFARGRGHALYAQAKQGKSLFVLWAAARLATTNLDADVIYLDYEMTRSDVRDRLEDMGYGPQDDLSRLHYALLPALPPLDTLEGANGLLELVRNVQREGCDLLVVIDTTGRAVAGEENSNDTIREFYRWTGSALKRQEVTWARLDHAGKDPTKGQRGGSAKNDDVDIVWRLQQADNGMILHRDAARMSWVPEKLTYALRPDPLRYEHTDYLWPAGTKPVADTLDRLHVPLDASKRKAREALREAGETATNDVLCKALKWRQQRLETVTDHPSDHFPDRSVDQKTDRTQKVPSTSTDHSTDRLGPDLAVSGPVSVSLDTDRSTGPYPTYCRCGQPARDISGLCPGCLANPGTLPPIPPHERF